MGANSRLTVAVHVLTWMALVRRSGREVVTSDQVAASVNTNPVVIRRILGMLRQAGLVVAVRGQGAGWRLARDADAISLVEVYDAIEPDRPFNLHPSTPNQACPIGYGIQPVLRRVYGGVEDAIKRELTETSIAEVLTETMR